MLTREFTRRAAGEQARTVLPKINVRALSALPVPVPPLHEQRRVVVVLEGHLSRLDAATRMLYQATARSVALGAAARRRLFEGLRRKSGLTLLLEVSSIANGQTPKGVLDLVTSQPSPGSLPYFKVGDMNVGDGQWMEASRNYIALDAAASVGLTVRPAGTVLIPKRGGAIATNKKRILRQSRCYDLNTMGIIPDEKLDSRYLWHWLESVDLAAIADGSNVPQINAPQIRRLSLPVPGLDAQRGVSEELDRLDQAVARIYGAVSISVQRGERLRDALLAAAFSGQLAGRLPHVAARRRMVCD